MNDKKNLLKKSSFSVLYKLL